MHNGSSARALPVPRGWLAMVVCPRCGSADAEPLGHVRSALEWHHCRRCRHVWPERQAVRGGPDPDEGSDPPVACGKCGREEARTVGRSNEFTYVQCSACGHTSVKGRS